MMHNINTYTKLALITVLATSAIISPAYSGELATSENFNPMFFENSDNPIDYLVLDYFNLKKDRHLDEQCKKFKKTENFAARSIYKNYDEKIAVYFQFQEDKIKQKADCLGLNDEQTDKFKEQAKKAYGSSVIKLAQQSYALSAASNSISGIKLSQMCNAKIDVAAIQQDDFENKVIDLQTCIFKQTGE